MDKRIIMRLKKLNIIKLRKVYRKVKNVTQTSLKKNEIISKLLEPLKKYKMITTEMTGGKTLPPKVQDLISRMTEDETFRNLYNTKRTTRGTYTHEPKNQQRQREMDIRREKFQEKQQKYNVPDLERDNDVSLKHWPVKFYRRLINNLIQTEDGIKDFKPLLHKKASQHYGQTEPFIRALEDTLINASRNGHIDIVKRIIKTGIVDINTTVLIHQDFTQDGPFGQLHEITPLVIAFSKNHLDIAKYLLEQGS